MVPPQNINELSVHFRAELTVLASTEIIELMVQSTNSERLAFSVRLKQALDTIPDCPADRGRAVWLKETLPFSVSAKATGKWLNGESMPTRENMAILAKTLGVSKAWLGDGEGTMTSPLINESGLRARSHQLLDKVPEDFLESVEKMLTGLTPENDR